MKLYVQGYKASTFMLRYTFYCIIFFIFSFGTQAQQVISQDSEDRLYYEALEHFQKQSYQVSKPLLNRYLELPNISFRPEANYYLAYAKLKTGDASGINELERFIHQEGSHPLALTGYFIMGNHFFDKKEFDVASRYYSQVDFTGLSMKDQEEYYFKKGYSFLIRERKDEAIRSFSKAHDYRGDYFNETSYYLGQIYFDQKNYREALAILGAVDDVKSDYQSEIVALVASCYYYQRSYSLLFKYAEEKLTRTINVANKTLTRLVGEAYFEKKNYEESSTYLERHLAYAKGRADAELYFRLAFAYFQIGDDQKAIDNFKLAGLDKGQIGQASSFYLGQLYIRTRSFDYAYSAFRNVIQNSSDGKMVEEASFLVGKVNYQRKQFADAIEDLKSFLTTYPNSLWSWEANELLAQAYLSTSNYDQAIAHLEGISSKSTPLKKAYQKVTFQKGQLLFNDGKFDEAANSFDKSVSFPLDQEIAGEAYYLMGESYSQTGNYARAIAAYQNVGRFGGGTWSLYTDYGLAYVYYNQKNYDMAEDLFTRFVRKVSKASDYYLDAKLRLADCKYVQKQYDQSIKLYDEVKSQTALMRDYIYFQQGLAYNLKGDNQNARSAFQRVLDTEQSSYIDNALFQLGQTFIEDGAFQQGIGPLTRLIQNYESSNLVPYGRSRRALCYFNLNQLDKARDDYQYILDHNINHPAANSALLGLQEVARKGGNVPGFDQYMDNYKEANPDDGSLEVVAFESAKGKYYNGQYAEAIAALDRYIQKYPGSGFTEDAYYFLADAYFRNEQWEKSSEYFMKLSNMENTAYLTRALDKAGRALDNQGNYEKAISVYRRLYDESRNAKDLYNAQKGLMDVYLALGNADSTLKFADEILSSEWKPPTAESDVWMVKGRIFLSKQNYNRAMDEFLKVVNESKSEKSAEAKYLIGKIHFEQKAYKQSLEVLFDLNRNFGSYPYWVGKSFLLIADDYLAMEEYLQAQATLQSIVENAKIEEIVSEAKSKLKQVEAAEKNVLIEDTTKTNK